MAGIAADSQPARCLGLRPAAAAHGAPCSTHRPPEAPWLHLGQATLGLQLAALGYGGAITPRHQSRGGRLARGHPGRPPGRQPEAAPRTAQTAGCRTERRLILAAALRSARSPYTLAVIPEHLRSLDRRRRLLPGSGPGRARSRPRSAARRAAPALPSYAAAAVSILAAGCVAVVPHHGAPLRSGTPASPNLRAWRTLAACALELGTLADRRRTAPRAAARAPRWRRLCPTAPGLSPYPLTHGGGRHRRRRHRPDRNGAGLVRRRGKRRGHRAQRFPLDPADPPGPAPGGDKHFTYAKPTAVSRALCCVDNGIRRSQQDASPRLRVEFP